MQGFLGEGRGRVSCRPPCPGKKLIGPSFPSDIAGDGPFGEGSDKDDDDVRDAHPVAAGEPSPLPRSSNDRCPVGSPVPVPSMSGKRRSSPPYDESPVRPAARARRGDGSTPESAFSAETSDARTQGSGASSGGGIFTRSRRQPSDRTAKVTTRAKARGKRGVLPPCESPKCGSTSTWPVQPEGSTSELFLCAACHLPWEPGMAVKHLGVEWLADAAKKWVEECQQNGERLPDEVVEGYCTPLRVDVCATGGTAFARVLTQ